MAKKNVKQKTIWDKIKLDFKKVILGSIILNVLFLILGVIIYLNPIISAGFLGILLGMYFVIYGIYNIYEFLLKDGVPIFKFKIILGILAIILGIFVMLNPFKIIKILTLTLGIYLIINAVYKAFDSFKFKRYGYDGWLLTLVISILMLIFGVFIAINPMASIDLTQASAIFIILGSILEICNLVMIYTKAKEIVKLFRKAK